MSTTSLPKSRTPIYASFVVIICAGMFGSLAQTVPTVNLSLIAADLHTTLGTGQWFTNIYQFVLGITMPLVAFLSKRYSLKRLFIVFTLFYIAGTFISFLAWDFWSLLAGRVLEAASDGVFLVMAQLYPLIYFGKKRRGLAMGIAGVTLGFAPSVAPTIAGAITVVSGWRTCFLALALFAVVVFIVGLIIIQKGDRKTEEVGFDTVSLVWSSFGFGGVLLGLSNASDFGFASPFSWLPIVIGACSLVIFVRRQYECTWPLINMDIFKSRVFIAGSVMNCLLYAALFSTQVIIPLFVEEMMGGSPLDAGLTALIGAITAIIGSLLGGALMDRFTPRPVIISATIIFFISGLGFIPISPSSTILYLAIVMGIRQLGVGALIMVLTTWSVSELKGSTVRDGTSIANALRQTCGALGTAVMIYLVSSAGGALVGYRVAMIFGATLIGIILIMSFTCVRSSIRR